MSVAGNKIELTAKENDIFVHQLKIGIVHQLYKEKLLTYEQFKQLHDAINNTVQSQR